MASVAHAQTQSKVRSVTLRGMLIHRSCDRFSGFLICLMLVFSPWAFATARPPAIWTMNCCGYVLGLFLAAKVLVRLIQRYQPERVAIAPASAPAIVRLITILLAVLSVVVPVYCLIAALNARASYDVVRTDFVYRDFISWLPHSYDRDRSFQMFARLAALACFFWSARDWMLGKTEREIREARSADGDSPARALPDRMRTLFTVLTINGALLGVEGIIQRLAGTPKPLWLLQMKINADPLAQFGAFPYRANAAQYFNLLWPACFGFWWMLSREARRRYPGRRDLRRWRPHWLLVCVAVMVACPIISLSRGGAFIAFGSLAVAAILTVVSMRHRHPGVKFAMLLFFGAALSLGLYFGWDQLSERLVDTESGYVQREAMYDTARKIAADYPLFGVGPGAFSSVFQLYRESSNEYWPAQLHNDWLETLVTFGWLGSSFIFLSLLLVLARFFLPGNFSLSWRWPSLICLGLAGCLTHARFDYPLQMYSILMLFVLLCAVLFSFSLRARNK